MTRKRPFKNGDNEPENAGKHELGERTLYITIFNHKERTTRVYTRDDEVETFYSTKSDAPLYDVGRFLLEIDAKIDPKRDSVTSDWFILNSLREHHRSILKHIQDRAEITRTYAIYTSWTMKVENAMENGEDRQGVEKGKEEEQTEELVASDYFMHSSIERERRLLDEKRAKWITRRMDMITKERLLGMGVEYRVNKEAVEKKPGTKTPEPPEEAKRMLGLEQCCMELLLICEVNEWEHLFWNKFKAFLDKIGNDRVEEKERLTKEWWANCWKRLNTQMHTAMKRMAYVDDFEDKDLFLKSLGKQWALSISQFFEGVGNPDVISLSKFSRQIRDIDDEEIRLRIENEIEDIEFRLERGSYMGRFDQFWDDDALFDCRYSRSKWLNLNRSSAPLEVYSHALKGNKNITHISFSHMDSDFDVHWLLRDLPWVTSISLDPDLSVSIPAVHRDLSFIKSTTNNLTTFVKEIKLDSSTYIFLDVGAYDLISSKLGRDGRVLISFVGPTCGESLTLRVKHSGNDVPLEVCLGSTKIQFNPSSKSLLTIDDITLYPIQVSSPSESYHLSFVPEVWNDIFIRFIVPADSEFHHHGHFLHDIQLLDEDGLEYMPHPASISVLSN